jgi:enterochelin esterase-like enzyme
VSAIGDLLIQLEGADPETAPFFVRELLQHAELPNLQGGESLRAARAITVHAGPQQLPIAGELAGRAHQAGVPGAGALFAECADKIALMTGRPQRFGTVVLEHQGDLVMGPIDGIADDEMRNSFGLPPLLEMRQRIEKQNQSRARERYQAVGLPLGQKFCRVWSDPTVAELRAGLASNPEGAWVDGNDLTMVCQSTGNGIIPGPVFELPMWNVTEDDDGPSDLWCSQIRVDRLAEAVFGYGFWPLNEDGMPIGGRGPVDHRFRGTAAPAELPSHEDDALIGSLETHEFTSAALRENRRVKVYLPPGHTTDMSLPVIYSTDGNMIQPYIRRVDAAIAGSNIPPVILIGAHAAPMDRTGNERALEYLPGFDDQRFDRHQRFFVDELSSWAESEFGASNRRELRAIFGCSDGAGHALATASMHRQRFGHCIAYSTGMPPDEQTRWDADGAPFVHLCAGTLEQGFHQATEAWAAWLHFHKSPHHFTERVCGHDLIQWIEELPRAIARAWSSENSD